MIKIDLKKILGFAILFLVSFSKINAQSNSDSLKRFSVNDFLYFLKNHHPMMQQANLLIAQASNNQKVSLGGFDPYLYGNWENKRYDNKEYWRQFDGGLKVPFWFGIEMKSGYEQNRGNYLNTSDGIPQAGLVYAGISMPLLQNLITDERRTALRQARIFSESVEFERINMLNSLCYEGLKAYWEWVYAYNESEIYKEYIRLAEIRLNAIKTSFERGANPAIDTTEALILLQNREVGLAQALLDFKNASNQLSNFLWLKGNVPLDIGNNLVPISLDSLPKSILLNNDSLIKSLGLIGSHPEISVKQLKGNYLEAEKRLKTNKLLPKLNVNYNFLAEPVGGNPSQWNFNLFRNNFKYGIDFKMPLLFWEERGNLGFTKLKIQNNQLEISQKQLELQNKLKSSYNEYFYYSQQVNIYSQTVINYRKLTEAELKKFEIGESSVFLINSREIKLIESRVKLAELQSKMFKSLAAFYFASGSLYQRF